MAAACTWLLGRGASIANGLSWTVPDVWKEDLLASRMTRDAHVAAIANAILTEMRKPTVHSRPYRQLLDALQTRMPAGGHHRFLTTNWDYLLQREIDAAVRGVYGGVVPRFLDAVVRHLNGSVEPGGWQNRSPILLETDAAAARRASFEANSGFNLLLWSSLVVVVGMSFECDIDRGLLGALRHHEDNVPLGNAVFVLVEPNHEVLERTYMRLAYCFPRARGVRVNAGLAEWIASGMPELASLGAISKPEGVKPREG